MTDKNTLKQKLEETKAKIKSNSKDAHFADSLISDLLSIKGQLEHEPTLVHIAEVDIVSRFDGAHFEMCVTKDGTAVYRTRGGYTIVADYGLTSLNSTIICPPDSVTARRTITSPLIAPGTAIITGKYLCSLRSRPAA